MVFERPYNDLTLPEPDPHPDYARSQEWYVDPDCRQPYDGQGEYDYLYTFDNVASDTQGLLVLLNQSELDVILVKDMILESPVVVDYQDGNDISQILKAYDGQSIIGISHDGRHLEINANRELTFQNVQLKGNNEDSNVGSQVGGGISIGMGYTVILNADNDDPDFVTITDCARNAITEGSSNANAGGAINSGGILTINDNFKISNCRAYKGGAIYSYAGELLLNDVTFDHNTGTNGGGAIYTTALLTLHFGTYSNNRATNEEDGDGGAIFISGTLADISDATISENYAYSEGGAIYFSSSCTATLRDVTMVGNVLEPTNPETCGGAICIYGASQITLTGNTEISDHTAVYGGAICLSVSDITLEVKENTSIINNHATQRGGGIMVFGGTVNLYDGCQLVTNDALADGGGIALNVATSKLNLHGDPTFNGNTAHGNGGGIFVPNGAVTFYDTATFLSNVALNSGGSLFLGNNGTSATINNALFDGNSAEADGGAIASIHGNLSITDAIFHGNYAGEAGGAVYLVTGTAAVQHADFDLNVSVMGGAVFLQTASASYVQDAGSMTNNTAFDGEGGAIHNYEGSGMVKLGDILFTGNIADNGGAIYSPVSKLTIGDGSQFQDNVAKSKANKISEGDQELYDSNVQATVWTLFDQGLNNYDINYVNYVVTLDPNGGAGEPVETYLIPGDAYQIPESPFTKSLCTFTRWNTASNNTGIPYTDEEITPTESLTLFAQWKCPICCPPAEAGPKGPQGPTGPKGQDAQLFIASATIEPGIYEDGADLMEPIELTEPGIYFVQYWLALNGSENEDNRIVIDLNGQRTATHVVDEHLTGTHLVQGPTTLALTNATDANIKIAHGALMVFG